MKKYPLGDLWLTGNQILILDFIKRYRIQYGCPPTQQEMADGVGCTVGRAGKVVLQLVRKNLVRHEPNQSRDYVVITESGNFS